MELKELLEKENINIESINELDTTKVYVFKISFNEYCSREMQFNRLRQLSEALKAKGITFILIPVNDESERDFKDFQVFEKDKKSNYVVNKQALEKLDHTLCLNSSSLKFGIDNEDHIDCRDTYEMIDCIETLQEALDQKEKQDSFLSLLIEKGVDISSIKATANYMEYNSFVSYVCPELSEEEYMEIKKYISNNKN